MIGTGSRRHIPSGDIGQMDILPFSDVLETAQMPQAEYDVSRWLFVPPAYTEYRYLLGTRGKKPLICIGINPSTARPDHLDPTLQSVERIALNNGFDSFMMLNLCAQRATDPNDMARDYPDVLRTGNAAAFEYALGLSDAPVVWAAWGTMIENYLTESEQLACVFLLVDIRNPVSELDKQMYEWINYLELQPIIIATKADKINRSQLDKHVKQVREGLGADEDDILIPFSSVTKQGLDDIYDLMEQVIG